MSVQSGGTPEQQGNGQQQQTGAQQQGEQTGQQQTGSLLDEAAGQQQADADQQGGQTGNQTGGQQTGAAAQTLTAEQLADIVERAVDRRINDRLAQRLNSGGGERQDQQQGNSGGSGQQQDRPDQSGQQTSRIDPSDLREARSSYRDYVGDEITFFPFEREFANSTAQTLLSDRVGRGEDPDRAGREVARQVAASIRTMRGQYEAATVAALKRKGLLMEAADGQQPPAGGPQPGDGSSFEKGRQTAQRLLAHRMPQQGQQA